MSRHHRPSRQLVERVLTNVSTVFEIDEGDLIRSPGMRGAEGYVAPTDKIVVARHIFFWLVSECSGCSLNGLAEVTGFDRRTIRCALAGVTKRIAEQNYTTITLVKRVLEEAERPWNDPNMSAVPTPPNNVLPMVRPKKSQISS